MQVLAWTIRIALIAVGAAGLVLWLPRLCYAIYRWPREQEHWQLKVFGVFLGIGRIAAPVIFLLIGFGAGHLVRDYGLWVMAPALVLSTLWSWFAKWRFPEYRTSD